MKESTVIFVFFFLILITVVVGFLGTVQAVNQARRDLLDSFTRVNNLRNDIQELKQDFSQVIGKNKLSEEYVHGLFNGNLTGIYEPYCGFWVDTRGRNIDEINRTVTHEACHGFIEQYYEKEHFCGECK